MREAANIAAVAELHPDYMGFIFYPPSPRYMHEVSAELIRYIPDVIKTTGVFVDEEPEKIKERIVKHQLKAVQLHGKENVPYCAVLQEMGVEVIKAFGIHADFDFGRLEAFLPVVDYFLFDTQTVAHGGSGRHFDWRLLEKYPWQKPYFLSGGIGLNDVKQLKEIKDERLYAIDVNSRFELAPGLKDIDELKAFFKEFK